MERTFKYLTDKYGIDGARSIFEKICIEIKQNEFGNLAKEVRPSQGDGGLDILIGSIDNPECIYQCKYFVDKIGNSQREQIKSSFDHAYSTCPNTPKWILCIPIAMSVKELKWFYSWKSQKESQLGIVIELEDGAFLITQLKKYDLFDKTFDEDIRNNLDIILKDLNQYKSNAMNEMIYDDSDLENSGLDYRNCVFIKMLEIAKIHNVKEFASDFFNAELTEQTILSKGLSEEIKIYNNLKKTIYSVWQTQFRLYSNTEDGNELINKSYLRIEDLNSTTLSTPFEISLLAKKGILQQLADKKRIGWIKDFIIKLSEYIQEDNNGDNR